MRKIVKRAQIIKARDSLLKGNEIVRTHAIRLPAGHQDRVFKVNAKSNVIVEGLKRA